jgi:DNA-binding CsgD family transcriptional regulator/pimeloyl-ACP methyl ester carboxylesterase
MDAPPVQYAKASDGFDIAYSVCGEGRPVVMMWDMPLGDAGLLWSSPTMRRFFEPMASRFRLVQLDSRGSGGSTRNLRPDHTAMAYVLDIEAVVNRLGLDDLVLFAPVFSSQMAVHYLLKHPDRIAGLILMNPMPPESPWVGMKLYEDLYLNSWDMFLASYAKTFYQEGGEDWSAYLRRAVTQADFGLAAQALTNSKVDHLLPDVGVPVVVLACRDPVWPPLLEAARTFALRIPDARLVLFDGQGNNEIVFPVDSRPAPAIPFIEDFVRSLPSTRDRPVKAQAAPDQLSERELEVLRLVAAGKSNPEIAKELFITRNTVQNHVSSILIKTNLSNRAQAAVYAKEHGIV